MCALTGDAQTVQSEEEPESAQSSSQTYEQWLNIWAFWQRRQTKAQHIRQPNVGYFQDRVQEMSDDEGDAAAAGPVERRQVKQRWRQRRKSSSGCCRKSWDHRCAVNSLQRFLRKHRQEGSIRRPLAPAFG
ncbi:uncharacterized protein V6R79_021404 [Siganus canaliculatus]